MSIQVTKTPRFNIQMAPVRGDYQRIGMELREFIKRRTRKGIDVNNEPFEPYSAMYLEYRNEMGKTDFVNLEDRSEMHNSLSVLADNTKAELYYSDAQRAKVAFRHQTGAGRLPIRQHFGVNDNDAQRFIGMLNQIISDRIKKQWRN